MNTSERAARIGGLRRSAIRASVAAFAVASGLAGAGAAAAAPRTSHPLVAGVISTVAGGAGGPARATTVSFGLNNPESPPTSAAPCSVSYANGEVYAGGNGAVREVNPQTDWLTTRVGTGWYASSNVPFPGEPLGDGGPATSASLDYACGVAVDHSGNLVIADSNDQRIRVVAASTGTFYGVAMTAGDIYTVAGDGTYGFSGDGGPATAAELNGPQAVAVDHYGNLVIADTDNSRIRVVAASTGRFYGLAMTAGDIYRVAGDGGRQFAGDGGPAGRAELSRPEDVAVDDYGNLVIADTQNQRIRVVAARTGTFYGVAMTRGDIYTVAGDGTRGNLTDGVPATSAELFYPAGVAVDSAGDLLIADTDDNAVAMVPARSGTFYGQSMTAGDIYAVAGGGQWGFRGDGGPARNAQLDWPGGMTVDGSGNLLIADSSNGRIRAVAASTGTFYGQKMTAGDIYTVAGNGTAGSTGGDSPATRAQFYPEGVGVHGSGNLLIADTFDNRVRVVAATTGTFYGRSLTAGYIYTQAGDGIAGFSGDGGPAISAELNGPEGVTADGAGNLVIADTTNNRVRVVANTTGTFYGQAMTSGHIYTVAGDGTSGFSGDGGSAASAELYWPWDVAVDGTGNLVIADRVNYRVRVVAARTGTYYGQAMTAGDIYTVAGDGSPGGPEDGVPATSAPLSDVREVAVDGAGNLLLTNAYDDVIQVVAARTGTFYGVAMTAGDIYTVAGDGGRGYSGDGGPATSAELFGPQGVAVDRAGNLIIADTGNQRVRVVAASTGTFYGVTMTAGDIYTVAGDGTSGFFGDGGPATSAGLYAPSAVAVDRAGDLVIADSGNERIRMLTG